MTYVLEVFYYINYYYLSYSNTIFNINMENHIKQRNNE